MQTGPDGFFHLTYCTKIHPARGWEDQFGQLRQFVPRLKERLAPEQPFGLGLRLSHEETRDLLARSRLAELQDFLAQAGAYVFTLNGFPYCELGGEAVKSRIFAPDWRTPERLAYTLRLIQILDRLLPPGLEGSISTVPLSYKPWIAEGDKGALGAIVSHLAAAVAAMVELKAATGKFIHLDLEPEPDGLVETSEEVAAFYRDWLLPLGAPLVAAATGASLAEAREHLLAHLQVCLDTCHLAVEFEDPETALATYREAGIHVGKVQITAGLKIDLAGPVSRRSRLAGQLAPFTASPYLHQVIVRGPDGESQQFQDLQEALGRLDTAVHREWRVHYHMPLFVDNYHELLSTRGETVEVLALLREQKFSRHLEIETYTWEWLPPGLKLSLLDSLCREYHWVLEAMGVNGSCRKRHGQT